MTSGPAAGPAAALSEAVRREAGLIVAALHRLTGDFDLAEDAVQDAVVAALRTWPRDGVPDNPAAWLTTAARRRAIDLLRRAAREDQARRVLDAPLLTPTGGPALPGEADPRVPMMFGCCHPALPVEARVALTLRAVTGLTTRQIAEAFLVPEATLAQRIVRAKRKIVTAGIPLAIPATDLPARLDDVLTVVAVAYTASYLRPADPGSEGGAGESPSLAADAVWLAGLVAARLPRQAEAWGLLALLTLQESRARARFDDRGVLVPLAEQNRSRWDHPSIARAERYLERAALLRAPGRYQLQAAIAACHASAPSHEETDWLQILTLYDLLAARDPSPVVALNRAIALSEYGGAGAALEQVDALASRLDGYYLFHATRARLLAGLGRTREAEEADRRALALTSNPAEAALLKARLAEG